MRDLCSITHSLEPIKNKVNYKSGSGIINISIKILPSFSLSYIADNYITDMDRLLLLVFVILISDVKAQTPSCKRLSC